MTANDYLNLFIGQLATSNALLSAKVEELERQIKELKLELENK